MIIDWPALNTLAWLRLSCCGAEHPTRVEDFDGEFCVVGAPMVPHAVSPTSRAVDDDFFLGWVVEHGALEVPVSLQAHSEDSLSLWSLKALGPGIQTQRRAFFRLPTDDNVELFLLEGGAPTAVVMQDLSEQGIRCEADHWAIDPGERTFVVHLEISGHDLYIRSQIVWRSSADSNGRWNLGIKFLESSNAAADIIRRYIFTRQLELRRERLV